MPGGELNWIMPATLQATLADFNLSNSKINKELPARVGGRTGLHTGTLPGAPFQNIVKATLEDAPYRLRAACVLGSNPLLTFGNAWKVYKAFKELDFLMVADIFMTPTTAVADIVLPAATYLEFDNISSPQYSHPVILFQQKVTEVAECKSDYYILLGLARRLGLENYFWDTEQACLDVILKPTGLSFSELKRVGPITGTRQYRNYGNGTFKTPSGKVEIYSSQLKEYGFDPLPTYYELPETRYSEPDLITDYPLIFTNWKLDIYRHSAGRQIASLRAKHPEPILSIHPDTARVLGIKTNDLVYVETARGRIIQKAKLTNKIHPKVVGVDLGFWFPERDASELYGWNESNINILTTDGPPFSRELGSANLRGTACRICKVH